MTMTTDAETLVRRAYQLAEGNVMDVQGFVDHAVLFCWLQGRRTPGRDWFTTFSVGRNRGNAE